MHLTDKAKSLKLGTEPFGLRISIRMKGGDSSEAVIDSNVPNCSLLTYLFVDFDHQIKRKP